MIGKINNPRIKWCLLFRISTTGTKILNQELLINNTCNSQMKRKKQKLILFLYSPRCLTPETTQKIEKMSFTGTLDKCKACDKTVYVMDLLTLEGNTYHKNCFRCSHCNGSLVVYVFFFFFFFISSLLPYFENALKLFSQQISNYSSMDGVLYCKRHFEQLFKESVKSLHTGLFSLSLPCSVFECFFICLC